MVKKAGQFAGGFFNNPGVIILGIAIAFIAFFRGDIRGAFASVGEGLVNIEAPTINLPSFPDISFPDINIGLPGIPSPFPEATAGGDPVPLSQPGEGLVNPADAPTDPTPVDILISEGVTDPMIINPEAFDPEQAPQLFDPTQFQPPIPGTSGEPSPAPIEEPGVIVVPEEDPFGIGGGPSFEGGTTIFGGGIVDTLGEVLDLFPSLTASQARDVLEEFPGLTQAEFRQLDPDIINISPI